MICRDRRVRPVGRAVNADRALGWEVPSRVRGNHGGVRTGGVQPVAAVKCRTVLRGRTVRLVGAARSGSQRSRGSAVQLALPPKTERCWFRCVLLARFRCARQPTDSAEPCGAIPHKLNPWYNAAARGVGRYHEEAKRRKAKRRREGRRRLPRVGSLGLDRPPASPRAGGAPVVDCGRRHVVAMSDRRHRSLRRRKAWHVSEAVGVLRL